MSKFWVDLDDDEGLGLIETAYHSGGEPRTEPGPTLWEIKAMQRYIQGQFPDGWRIDDNGEIRGRNA